jgi:hypothetical protein
LVVESPLTENDVIFLQSYAGISRVGTRIWDTLSGIIVATCMIYVLLSLLSSWLGIFKESQYYNISLLFVAFAVALYLARELLLNVFNLPTADNPFVADLVGGLASVQRLNVKSALEIEEYEDEGVGFLLELEGGGVLCLISQDYYEYSSNQEFDDDEPDLRANFPQTVIEYRYGPNSGLPLNAKGVGESLRPVLKIPACPKFRKDVKTGKYAYCAPEDGTFYAGSLGDVCQLFGYRPVPISVP